MRDHTHQPPSKIICSRHRSRHRSQSKQIRKRWRGSHHGYSGGTETVHTTSCSSDEELASSRDGTLNTTLSRQGDRIQFYNNMPKRRLRKPRSRDCTDHDDNESRAKICNSTQYSHPEIDLTAVRLISCQEYDLRLRKKEHDFLKLFNCDVDLSQSEPSDGSDASDNEKKQMHGSISGPLAVIDHGPVFEFGTSNNLLNEIYNINPKKNKSCDNKLPSPPTLLGSSKRNNHLALRGNDDGKRAHGMIIEKKVPIETVSLNMDEAVSFSPFARCVHSIISQYDLSTYFMPISDEYFFLSNRVIFDAQPPHTIVHINAAYSSLVSQGIVKSSYPGEPLIDLSSMCTKSSAESIPTIVVNHLQKIAASLPPYQIFPVISRMSDFHVFEAYKKLQYSRPPGTPLAMKFDTDIFTAENESGRNQHFVSYYMLQIESNSQIQQCFGAHK